MAFKSSYSMSRLNKAIEKFNSKEESRPADPRYWKLATDKSGNGKALIRFLPPCPKDGDDAEPLVRYWDHYFKGPGGIYWERSLSSLPGRVTDPVGELNRTLWNASEDDKSPEREQARKQKRRLRYVSNILVLKDELHPENEGKVFLYEYGQKIAEKISAASKPEFAEGDNGDDESSVFCMEKGANFVLKVKQVSVFANYDDSYFMGPSKLPGNTQDWQKIADSMHSLLELVDIKTFKSYDQLKKHLDTVLGMKTGGGETISESRKAPTSAVSEKKTEKAAPPWDNADDEDEDDDLKRFRDLAKE